MEEKDLLIFQSGEINIQMPLNVSNIDALIMILESLKVGEVNEDKPPKTQLRTQKSGAEHGSGPKRKSKGNQGKRFPKELVEFVKKRVDELNNSDLCDEINKEFDLNMVSENLSKWIYSKGIKRIKKVRSPKSDSLDLRTIGKYPPEMKEFIRSRMETNSNQDLTDLINEEFSFGITMTQIKNYMKNYQLKRVHIIRTPRRKKEKVEKVKKKMGKPKKYTDEILQFLRDNINNFNNKQLCEELESRFNVKATPEGLGQTLSQKGIRRDQLIQTDVDPKIVDFIMENKTKEIYALRDQIIEEFEKYIPMEKLKNLMGMPQRKQKLPGESVDDEVKRIKEQRESYEPDDDLDGLELDD